jgi:hypothetical protein
MTFAGDDIMSDANTHRTQVTSQVTSGPAAAGPEQPPMEANKPFYVAFLLVLRYNPTVRKIAMPAALAVVLLLAFAAQYAVSNKAESATAGARDQAFEFADDDLDDNGADTLVNIAIPSDLDLSAGLHLPPDDLLKKKSKVVTTARPAPTSESKPRPRAPRPRFVASAQAAPIPEWLQPIQANLAIPERYSLRSESAVDPDALATLKWSDLAPDQQEWFRGRAALELRIMAQALALLERTFPVAARSEQSVVARLAISRQASFLGITYVYLMQTRPPEEIPGLVQGVLRGAAMRFSELGYTPPDFSEGLAAK